MDPKALFPDIGPAIDRFSKTIKDIADGLHLVRDAKVDGMIQGGVLVGLVLVVSYLFFGPRRGG